MGTKLDASGEGLKQWLTDVYNHMTVKWGPDVTIFVRDRILPPEHTQSAERRYEISAGGSIIINKMPGMIGTFVDVDKKITKVMVESMSLGDKEKLKKIGTSYYGTVKKNVAVVYAPMYDNDPFSGERVAVHSEHVDMLTKFETDWVGKLAAVSADMANWLVPALRFRMENLSVFCKHRDSYRPELMLQNIVEMVISANAGDVVEKKQMSITILAVIDKLLHQLRLGHDEDIDKYLNRYDEVVQRLYVLGWNNRHKPLPAGEDTNDYMIGVNLIRSVAGHRFDDLIAKDDNDKLLEAPTCTYIWARNRVKRWSDELQSSFKTVIGGEGKSKKRGNEDNGDGESAFKKATVMISKVFDHASQLIKNKNNSDEASRPQSGAGSTGTPAGSKIISYDEWKKTKTCRHCQQLGHFDSECPKATEEEKASYLAEHRERKRKNKNNFNKK